jgi:hypothetical protein
MVEIGSSLCVLNDLSTLHSEHQALTQNDLTRNSTHHVEMFPMIYMGKPLHKIYGTRLDTSRRVVVLWEAIDDYYSGSWVAISTITLNGDLARAAQGGNLGDGGHGGHGGQGGRWCVLCWLIISATPKMDRKGWKPGEMN